MSSVALGVLSYIVIYFYCSGEQCGPWSTLIYIFTFTVKFLCIFSYNFLVPLNDWSIFHTSYDENFKRSLLLPWLELVIYTNFRNNGCCHTKFPCQDFEVVYCLSELSCVQLTWSQYIGLRRSLWKTQSRETFNKINWHIMVSLQLLDKNLKHIFFKFDYYLLMQFQISREVDKIPRNFNKYSVDVWGLLNVITRLM